ncbi:MAG: hypothetical protein K8S99_02930 [Planctomycetes bacterium]|nr:hypothetical protein [Planctomycetota bacterium]
MTTTAATADPLVLAKAKLAAGTLIPADLDALVIAARTGRHGRVRQRIMYLHAAHPTIRAEVLSTAIHEPVPGSVTQIDPLAPPSPYATVFDAILDGWRVIHFPNQLAPFDDREIDVVGYEFVLEKLEAYPDA